MATHPSHGSGYRNNRISGEARVHFGNVYHNHHPATSAELTHFNKLAQGDKDSALWRAAEEGQIRRLAILIQCGADIDSLRTAKIDGTTTFDCVDPSDKHPLSALHLALIHGREECAELLLSSGADVKLRGAGGGIEPLEALIESSHISTSDKAELIEWLFSQREWISARRGGSTIPKMSESTSPAREKNARIQPLSSSETEGEGEQQSRIRSMIADGTKVNDRINSDGDTPLFLVREVTDLHYLLRQPGIDIEARNSDGRTALRRYVQEGLDSCVATILEAGADVNALDTDGHSILWAVKDTKCLMLLLRYGIEARHRAWPLHHKFNSETGVYALLKAWSNPEHRTGILREGIRGVSKG